MKGMSRDLVNGREDYLIRNIMRQEHKPQYRPGRPQPEAIRQAFIRISNSVVKRKRTA